jgi:hypothetical protein
VASKLLAKADVRPLCLPAGSLCIRGLFSIMASFTQSADDLPSNSFVLSYRQHEAFHGSLAGHPACKTWVDVNFDNRSTLRLLSSGRVLAENIEEERKKQRFRSVDAFADFCARKGHALSLDDKLRIVAHCE